MRYFIDLFCGCGGVTESAYNAGFDVVVGVDCWKEALQMHKVLHPESRCLDITLGGDKKETYDRIMQEIPKYRDGVDTIHCHASPPCQNLSAANMHKDHNEGLRLVHWSVDFLTQYFSQSSWSFEQVPSKIVRDYLSERGIANKVINMSEYGVPQCRKRLIAASHDIFDQLEKSHRIMSSVVTAPEKTCFLGNSFCSQRKLRVKDTQHEHTRKYDKDKSLSYTVTSKQMYFIDSDYFVIRSFTLQERALLQTFSEKSANLLGSGKRTATLKFIGNCVPPYFFTQVLRLLIER